MLDTYRPFLRCLTDAGHQAYFVGGCVRDMLLGREIKDVDIATSATPDEVQNLFRGSKEVGAHFGVVIAGMGGLRAEIATFRKEGTYSDSRHPDQVAFTKDQAADATRRDFTMNAIFMDEAGELIDGLNGVNDIRERNISAVGHAYTRFSEDPLRIIRAVRFMCQLDFAIDERTWNGMMWANHKVQTLSIERIIGELLKILTSGRAATGIWALHLLGVLDFILPEWNGLRYTKQNPKHHPEGTVEVHTLKLLEQLPPGCSETLALAALLHDIGKPATAGVKDGQPTFYGHEEAGAKMTFDILTRWKLPNYDIDKVVSLVDQHMTFRYCQEMRKAKLYRFLRQSNFEELLELHHMDALAGSGNLEHYDFCLKALIEVPVERMRPEPLITGFDFIALGLKPGPAFRQWLDLIETAQLEGTVTTKEEAIALVFKPTYPQEGQHAS